MLKDWSFQLLDRCNCPNWIKLSYWDGVSVPGQTESLASSLVHGLWLLGMACVDLVSL